MLKGAVSKSFITYRTIFLVTNKLFNTPVNINDKIFCLVVVSESLLLLSFLLSTRLITFADITTKAMLSFFRLLVPNFP
jgi:hypothetical protein